MGPAEKAFGCLQVGVKRGGRRGPAYHRAEPFVQESGGQMADLAEAGGNGQDAVMFLGSQGALLGAVQVCTRGGVPPPDSFHNHTWSILLISIPQEESLLSFLQPRALLPSVQSTNLLNAVSLQ